MKRYLIAASVALAVFAGAAFAATLNVDGGVLQAGQDTDLTCSDNAVVSYSTQTVGGGGFAVNGITVTFDEGCDGNFAYLATFSGPGSQNGFGIKEISGNKVTFTVNLAPVDTINAVSVAVKNTNDGAPTHPWVSGIITG